jgi:hypothetical protein
MTPLTLYVAWLGDVLLRSTIDTPWLPTLILLVAFKVMRTPSGIAWCALAGLVCDGIAERPLGVTMLAATLTATVMREVGRLETDNTSWHLVKAFAFVAIVECASRAVVESIDASPDVAVALTRGIQTAIATTGTAAVLVGTEKIVKRNPQQRRHETWELRAVGRLR